MQPHFAPSPNRSLFFAQESTVVPSPSLDHLQDNLRRVESVSSCTLIKLTLTHTQHQPKAHQSWRHRPRNLPLQASVTTTQEPRLRRKRLQSPNQSRPPNRSLQPNQSHPRRPKRSFSPTNTESASPWATPNPPLRPRRRPQSPPSPHAPRAPRRDNHALLRRQKLHPCPLLLPKTRAPQHAHEAALQLHLLPTSQLLPQSQRPPLVVPAPCRQPIV
jgi:hypothetical protein